MGDPWLACHTGIRVDTALPFPPPSRLSRYFCFGWGCVLFSVHGSRRFHDVKVHLAMAPVAVMLNLHADALTTVCNWNQSSPLFTTNLVLQLSDWRSAPTAYPLWSKPHCTIWPHQLPSWHCAKLQAKKSKLPPQTSWESGPETPWHFRRPASTNRWPWQCWWWRLIGLCTGPSPVLFCGPQWQTALRIKLKLLLLQCHWAC